MNLPELQKQIVDKKLDNVYVFLGDEIAVQKIYTDKMASILNLEVQYVTEYKSIINKKTALFGAKKLYVVVNDNDITKKEDVWETIKQTKENIIFKYTNYDKRSKFLKYFENNVVEFNILSPDILKAYIKKELPLCDTYCNELIKMCDSNYNQILLELDKIKNYDDAVSTIDGRFNSLMKQNAFHKEVSDTTFELIDAFITRNRNKVVALKKDYEKQNDSCLGLISLLYNNYKVILLIQSCKSNDICKTTGLQNNQVYYNKEKTGYYSIGELVAAMRLLQKMDTGIKRGTLDEKIALDYFIVNIL